jgi:PPK2 family polyphosphate:nucleotide phosphotransferase
MARRSHPGARWLVAPGSSVRLTDRRAGATPGAAGDKDATHEATAALKEELVDLQARLWAEHRHAVLLVVQAIDAGGKDGMIRNVLSGTNPAGVQVTSFKQPTEEELDHDFLWRVHAHVPRKGHIGVFNRSHYEDVLVVRVHDLIDKPTWKRRYDQIRSFESHLAAEGTTIVKVFLHISKEEQRERLQARVDSPEGRWKFSLGDLPERALWKDYAAAFGDAIEATSTAEAPWFVIPADRKWYRDWAVTTILVDTLRQLDPQYPPAAEGVTGLVIT